MKLQNYIPLHITIFLILGILTGFYAHISINLFFTFLLLGFGALIVIFFFFKNRLKPSFYFTTVSLLIFFLIGVVNISIRKENNQKNHYTNLKLSTTQNSVLKILAVLKPNSFYNRYEAQILQINNETYQGKILLNVKKDSLRESFSVDNKLLVIANFKAINSPKNPGQFDYKFYLKKQHIYAQLTVDKNNIKILQSNTYSLKGFAHRMRTKIISNLQKQGFKDDELAIISSLLLGQRQEVSKELLDDYAKAGAIHILAISGLHIGIILWFLNFLLKPLTILKNGKTIKLIIAVLLLWCFAFIAGMSASVVRAVTIFSAVAISLMGKRKYSVYYALVFSAFILLLAHPLYLFDVGFQLSYLAVFFIVWLQPKFENLWSPKFKIVKYFWQLFTVSLAAQLGVLPLSLYYFHQFPALFFVTNLVIIPFLGILLGLGLIIIILALLNFLPKFLATFYELLINLMNSFIELIAKQESFLFENITFSALLMLLSYLFIICFFNWTQKKSFKTLRITLICLVLLQTAFIYEKWKTTSTKEIVVFNQSQKTLIAKRNGKNLSFYSTDSISKNSSIIKSYLQKNDVKNVSLNNKINTTLLLDKNIFIVDSLGIYNIANFHPEKVLLTNAPKINLERLILNLKPQIIIADNSNYKYLITNWKKTCKKHNISFYYTNKSGAFNVTY